MSWIPTIPRRRRAFDRLAKQTQPFSAEALAATAIIFAPHPDDETLGCGGTIIKKISAGADVAIVFMTDGCASHSTHGLAKLRKDEAIAAAESLGVSRKSVHFLDFPDGALKHHESEAVKRVRSLLTDTEPSEVFIPHRHDKPDDHRATRRIVLRAIEDDATVVNEYPVWFWNRWPYVRLSFLLSREATMAWLNTLQFRLPSKTLNASVFIGDELDHKRRALEQHSSQMRRPNGKPGWPILSDVSHGDFLNAFFEDYELFHRYRVNC